MAYKGKKVLAIVPARSGSKGIPQKNLIKIGGLSLIAHAAQICEKLDWLDHAVISTDDKNMLMEGVKFGLDAPFVRPEKLSTDEASALEMWTHAFIESEKHYGVRFDVSILLEPSSPLRKPEQITRTITKLVDGNHDSILTLSLTDSKSHPLKQLIFNDERLDYYENASREITARQQLNEVYHRNGVAYLTTRECLLVQKKIIGSNASAVIIDEPVVNIDTLLDFKWAELLFHEQKDK